MPAKPILSKFAASAHAGPAGFAEVVVPDTPSTEISRAIYVGTAGTLTVVMAGSGAAVLFTTVVDGITIDIRTIQVNSVGTTATNMVALW